MLIPGGAKRSHYSAEHSHRTNSELDSYSQFSDPHKLTLLTFTYELHKTISRNASKRRSRGAISQPGVCHRNQCKGLWKTSQLLRKGEW